MTDWAQPSCAQRQNMILYGPFPSIRLLRVPSAPAMPPDSTPVPALPERRGTSPPPAPPPTPPPAAGIVRPIRQTASTCPGPMSIWPGVDAAPTFTEPSQEMTVFRDRRPSTQSEVSPISPVRTRFRSNARRHPHPYSTSMRGPVPGRRVRMPLLGASSPSSTLLTCRLVSTLGAEQILLVQPSFRCLHGPRTTTHADESPALGDPIHTKERNVVQMSAHL